jgi:hypothetical protein
MAMQDVASMLRQYREQERPQLERLATAELPRVQGLSNKTHMVLFMLFMLFTTVFYMAWNIYHVNSLRKSVDTIVREQSTAEGKAQLFFNAVRKQKQKQGEI